MIIHFHFHFKTTGVTRSVESVLGPLDSMEKTRVFGYGISTHKISFFKLLKELYSKEKTVVHTHRNNETLFALALRFFGAKLKLFTTRHAESKPSSTTNYLMSKADQCIKDCATTALKKQVDHSGITHMSPSVHGFCPTTITHGSQRYRKITSGGNGLFIQGYLFLDRTKVLLF